MPQRHRPELSEAVSGERLVGYRRSTRTFARDRVCGFGGCTTKLSIYNSGRLCAVHAPYRSITVTLAIAAEPEPLDELAAS
ncbi:MAG TPA: hypothetical protein VE991_05230 [Acidimicrobiales bacterium]|nr:hypothetical protein [Acidimicrobiales bacterium]